MNWKDLKIKGDGSLYFTADPHLGEPRMAIMQRPFPDALINYTTMRENYNRIIKPNDLVIWNGDVVSNQAPDREQWLDRVNSFNGRKWLVMGNHDVTWEYPALEPYFERVFPHGDGIELDVTAAEAKAPETVPWVQKPLPKDLEELHLFVTHYPTQSRMDRFNLVGHIHAAWKYQKNMLNVGVDVNHFYPFHVHEVFFYLTAITSFYDDDVWCSMHKANALHIERGKPGSYFKKIEAD